MKSSLVKCSLRLLFGIGVGLLTSCVSTPDYSPQGGSVTEVFLGNYDQVWRATQKALVKYPIRINNSDTGLLQTDYIRGAKAYKPPYTKARPSSGYRHQITLRLAKGSLKGRPAVKVTVTNTPEMQRDFFSDATELKSDGMEERVILYRIRREMILEKAVGT
jgi:hypothetical protein